VLLGWSLSCGYAQEPLEEYILAGYITAESVDNEELQDQIEQWLANPLSWQNITTDDIVSLPFSPAIKNRLISFKKDPKTGSSWAALQQSGQFSTPEIEVIKLFITLDEQPAGHGKIYHYVAFKNREQHPQLTKNLHRGRWFHDSGWLLGWMTESDQGEPQVWDHSKISLCSPLIKGLGRLHLGAYRVHFGQGLIFNSSLMNLKSSHAVQNVAASRQRIVNYLGTDENRYLWGVAAQIRYPKWQFMSFYSRNHLDAQIQQGIAHTLPASGLHCSAAQLTAKQQLREQTMGVSGYYKTPKGQVGILLFNTGYSRPLADLNRLNHVRGSSFYHNLHGARLTLNGEFAWLAARQWATVQSCSYRHDNFAIGCAIRFFRPHFFTLLGGCPKEFGGMPNNEKGLYLGGELKLPQRWWLAFYMDFFSPVEPEDQARSTPTGTEAMIAARHRFSNGSVLIAKMKRTMGEDPWRDNAAHKKLQYKVQVTHQFDKQLSLICRLAHVVYSEGTHRTQGSAISCYGQKRFARQIRLAGGTVHFHGQSYAARTYLYEPGIPLRFNIACLQGSGYRVFLVAQKTCQDIFQLAMAAKLHRNKQLADTQWNLVRSIELQLLVDI